PACGLRYGRPRTTACVNQSRRRLWRQSASNPSALAFWRPDRSELKARRRRHHRCSACVHGGDDLLDVDPLQVDARGTEVGMAELALDDVQRDALAGELAREAARSSAMALFAQSQAKAPIPYSQRRK